MNDVQFGIIVTIVTSGLAGMASAFVWGVKRIARAMDRTSDALMGNTESNAKLSAKIDAMHNSISRNTPARGVRVSTKREEGD